VLVNDEVGCAIFVDPVLGSTGRAEENKIDLQLE
jgi:hypothetical protein